MKKENQSYEDRYKDVEGDVLWNIKKHGLYLDKDYEELQNFNFFQSDEEDNVEFSMINPNLLYLDLQDIDQVSNSPTVSAITDNWLLPNEQYCQIYS